MRRRRLLFLLATLGLVAGLLGPAGQTAQAGPEIVGGQPADEGEYPFMAGILHRGVSDRFFAQFCGGSLISPDTVLTAAHCMVGETAATLDVLVGTNHLDPGDGVRLPVRRVRVHPAYNGNTNDNDLAILQLGTELPDEIVANMQPNQTALGAPGVDATAIGWGNTHYPGQPQFPHDLFEVVVPMVSNADCAAAYQSDFIARSMVCAGATGRDTCQGDSGGPLLVPNGPDWVQVGITSFGQGCGVAGFPGVYSRVSTYAAFINPYHDPDTPPNAPARASSAPAGPHSVRVSWSPPVFDGGTRITQYRVRIPSLARLRIVDGSVRSVVFANLPPGQRQVVVRAVNAIGIGAGRTITISA